jgi:isopentenyl-diphosphate delta-isomerase
VAVKPQAKPSGREEKYMMANRKIQDLQQQVVLVNAQGQVTGYEEKLKAHQQGLLHQAFSVCIVNTSGEMLLQQRAFSKYHFAGLWSNTCCSHPFPGEDLRQGAHRRLKEEMGFDTELTSVFSFIYKAKDEKSGLTEHELDYVFTGTYDGKVIPDSLEIESYQWVPMDVLSQWMESSPGMFTEWFKLIVARLHKDQLLPK